MSLKFGVQSSKSKIQSLRCKSLILLFTFFLLLPTFACRIPNLEGEECTKAREQVRDLYSIHFGNEMKPSAENLKLREKYLTPELREKLENQTIIATDYFTQTDDYPKAFRVGECQTVSPDKTILGVLLFWKTDTRSEQRVVDVEVVKRNENWLVNSVQTKN